VKITTDKIEPRISFSAEQIGGNLVLHDDYDIIDATIEPLQRKLP
jgi:hypothetical protein